jgi:hypothetical protein
MISVILVTLGGAAAWFLLQFATWYLVLRILRHPSFTLQPGTIMHIGAVAAVMVFFTTLIISVFWREAFVATAANFSAVTLLLFTLSSGALRAAVTLTIGPPNNAMQRMASGPLSWIRPSLP